MLTGPAAGIEHAATPHAALSQLDEGWLGGAYARLWRMQSGGFKEPGPNDYIDAAPAAE